MTGAMERPLLLVGCGKMGSAMLAGWLESGIAAAGVHAVEPQGAAGMPADPDGTTGWVYDPETGALRANCDGELLRQGSAVHLCWECVSGRGEEYRRHALERMVQAGAVLTNHESVAFEWARDKNHPAFRDMSGLLKGGLIVD